MINETIVTFKDVCMYFGGLKAIEKLSFTVEKGKIFGIIGPNGAGKTTVFNVLSGVYIPTAGEIYFKNQLLNNIPAHRITGNGIARTFQNIRLFDDMTVLDNMKVAHYGHIQYGVIGALLNTKKKQQEEKEIEKDCMEVLEFLGLSRYAGVKAGALPYGLQRRIEIARALSCKPEVLLLDEPAAGMNPAEIDTLNQLIIKIRDHYDLTILLVEHQMRLIMNICDEILVVNFGQKMIVGKPEEIRNNQEVLEAYLGKRN